MKKLIIAVLSAFFLLTNSAATAFSAEAVGYEYTIINGEVTIVGYKGEPEFIEIPEFIEGCPVTEVRDNAFYRCSSLREIVLPDTVLKIGHHSFYACYSLEKAVLPVGLEEIGMGCFCGCTELKAIEIPDTIDVMPESCFRACTALRDIRLPLGLKKIESFCFAGCTELRSVNMGDSLVSVGERAFYMCEELECAVIPSSCGDIGEEAFGYSCDGNEIVKTDMLIVGGEKSAAEVYAEKNKLRFAENDEAVPAFAAVEETAAEDEAPEWFIGLGIVIFGSLILVLTAVAFYGDRRKK